MTGREVLCNLRVNNALNDREVIWVGSTLRPRGGDLTSPARETVRSTFAYKVPFELTLTATFKM